MSTAKLTPKQRAFIDAYMGNGFNAGQAAITAGYSEDTAYSQASRLLRNVNIASEIKILMRDYIMPAEEVLSRLTEHGRGDIGDLWDESTGQIDWTKARAWGKTGLIKRIKHKTTRVTRENGEDVETFEDEVELHNPQVALQMLGKYHEVLTDKLKITITWEDQAVEDIRAGRIEYAAMVAEFEDEALVAGLFKRAGVPVKVGTGESQE